MNRSERKYFATAARMDEALLALLEKKNFAYITVKEICAAAGGQPLHLLSALRNGERPAGRKRGAYEPAVSGL